MSVDGRGDDDRRGIGENRQQGLNQEERAFDVDVEGAIEGGGIPLVDGAKFGDPCVYEGGIEAAEFFFESGGDGGLDRGVAGVRFDDEDVATEFLASGVERGGIFAGDGDTRPFFEKFTGGFEADAGSAAGDEAALAFEAIHFFSDGVINRF